MGHSPGPWHWEQRDPGWVFIFHEPPPPPAPEGEYQFDDRIPVACVSVFAGLNKERAISDIALLCATPDLLAALRALLDAIDGIPHLDADCSQLTAIRKAEGAAADAIARAEAI